LALSPQVLAMLKHFQKKSSDNTPKASQYRLAQIALNHSRLDTLLDNFKTSLTNTFMILNDSVKQTPISLDHSTQQALTDLCTHKENFKRNIQQLVLRPETAQRIFSFMDDLDDHTKQLQTSFESCVRMSKTLNTMQKIRAQ
jgi:hypothetical protein